MAYFQHYEISAQLTALYMYSCHQAPDRSFWILGYPAALCCRCLGVYIGTCIACAFAIFNKLKINFKTFLILLLIVGIDVLINYGFGIRAHNTGNIIRFLVGIIMGLLIVIILQYLYERNWKKLCSRKQ